MALAQLLVQKRHDAGADGGAVGLAAPLSSTRTSLLPAFSLTVMRYCSTTSFVVGLPELGFVEDARLVPRDQVGIGVTDEVGAGGAVTVNDGETDAIEREADAAPGAFKLSLTVR